MSALTLYAIEERLALLMDAEDTVSDEQLAEFTADLAEAHEAALAKRDRVIQFIRHVESQIQFCRDEEARIYERRQSLEKGLERFQTYVLGVIEASGNKSLEGRVGKLLAKANPPKVEISDAEAISYLYKNVVVKMSAVDWQMVEAVIEDCELGTQSIVSYAVDKAAIKKVIQAGEAVPGCDLKFGSHLEVK